MVKLIKDLIADKADLDVPVFFDTTSYDQFDLWTKLQPKEYKELKRRVAEGLKIVVFEEQLESTHPGALDEPELEDEDDEPPPPHPVKAKLDELDVEFLNSRWHRSQDKYATELEMIYFHDDAKARNHAEFFIMARFAHNSSSRDEPLRILTGYTPFLRTKQTEVIMLSAPAGSVLPGDFDVFADLNIHAQLWQAAKTQFESGDYPASMFQAALELLDHLRTVSNEPTADGKSLINDKLEIKTSYTGMTGVQIKKGTKPPKHKLNGLRDGNEIGEHEAYYYFILGCNQLIRNAMAHSKAKEPFIQKQFGKQQIKVIKLLAFLSLLLEKLDESKAHNP